jgi:DNA-directed RNA polymerase subunit M/transcription elongation factor TFIIS
MKHYCPDCVEVLKVKHGQKFGSFSVWLVCPKCGYRIREGSLIYSNEKNYDQVKKDRQYLNNEFKEL